MLAGTFVAGLKCSRNVFSVIKFVHFSSLPNLDWCLADRDHISEVPPPSAPSPHTQAEPAHKSLQPTLFIYICVTLSAVLAFCANSMAAWRLNSWRGVNCRTEIPYHLGGCRWPPQVLFLTQVEDYFFLLRHVPDRWIYSFVTPTWVTELDQRQRGRGNNRGGSLGTLAEVIL